MNTRTTFSANALGNTHKKKETSNLRRAFKVFMVLLAVIIIGLFSFVLVSGFKGVWDTVKQSTVKLVSKKI
jgi:magnesium-transporting ATPase (P-type)